MTTMKTATRDPRETPAYTLADAARYVRVPVATLSSWVSGRGYPIRDGKARSSRLITPASSRGLSFVNLVEAHVLAGIRRNHGVPMGKIRPALDWLSRELEVKHPLAQERFETDGVDLFVRRLGKLLNASARGQVAMQDVLALYLKRVEYGSDGLVLRFFPYTRAAAEPEQPRVIVINPAIMWGRPVVAGTRVDTSILFERHQAGESASEIAEDLRLTTTQVEEAVRCEAGWAHRAA
jgi:uncharacterized protein (DUF433 family)